MSQTYKIVRFFKDEDKEKEIIRTGLSLEEAKEHCNSSETEGDDWFDGFCEE